MWSAEFSPRDKLDSKSRDCRIITRRLQLQNWEVLWLYLPYYLRKFLPIKAALLCENLRDITCADDHYLAMLLGKFVFWRGSAACRANLNASKLRKSLQTSVTENIFKTKSTPNITFHCYIFQSYLCLFYFLSLYYASLKTFWILGSENRSVDYFLSRIRKLPKSKTELKHRRKQLLWTLGFFCW